MTLPVAGAPIGVFDSGMGGLTVLAALRSRMPGEDFLYLGDTARLPYGTKSGDTVARYALQAAEALVARGIKALVVACNTASSVALPALRARFPGLPVIGVVDPGAEAAVRATRTGHIAVIATEGTVRGGAYQVAIERLMPGAQVRSAACQVFVALAEEGWTEGPVADAAAESYLRPLLAWSAGEAASADVLVLGCTHFPRLIGPISRADRRLRGHHRRGGARPAGAGGAFVRALGRRIDAVPRHRRHAALRACRQRLSRRGDCARRRRADRPLTGPPGLRAPAIRRAGAAARG